MKKSPIVLLLLYVSVLYSQSTIKEKLEWGQVINLTLPTTQYQMYNTINLHSDSVLIVPENVNLTVNGQVQGGKIIFLGNNMVTIKGDLNGNGRMEIGKYSSIEIVGSINSSPELIFSGINTLVANNIYGDASIIRLNGNTCLRIHNQLNTNTKFVGAGENNNVNYNVPAHWGYEFSAPNISFSNNKDVTCNIPACARPANTNTYGTNEWNGYAYSYLENNTNFSNAEYIGTLKEDVHFDRNMGQGVVEGRVGTRNICFVPPSDKFMVRYLQKMNLEAGTYNFTVGGDDGYRLSVDGGKTWMINNWKDHGYQTTTKQITFPAEEVKDVILEYYENTGGARISFTFGKIVGDGSEYGQGIWHVYGYNFYEPSTKRIHLPGEFYSGFYTQATLGVDTRDIKNNGWDDKKSPSTSINWKGAPIPEDDFTLSHKRQGFPCGQYEIILSNWDDHARLFLDDEEIWFANSHNSGTFTLSQKFVLNADSKLELRLKEHTGGAGIKMELKNVPVVYDDSSFGKPQEIEGAAIRIESNVVLLQDLDVCSCTVVAGQKLTIAENITLTLQEELIVENNAEMIIENMGSLVQINDHAKNLGSVKVRRDSAPVIQTDYTYWSTPVGLGFTLHALSPNTPSSKYYQWDPIKEWQLLRGGAHVMEAGRGYIVRAPYTFDKEEPKIFEAMFEGTPHNGIVSQNITANRDNLIGNPYPSAIHADDLYWANSKVISGTFQFWTHNTPISSKTEGNYKYNYSTDDYASYNILGGVKTVAAKSGGKAPTGNIASGQGFFVNGTSKGGTLNFKNAMRVNGNNSQFFRASTERITEKLTPTFEKHRLWLNISNEEGIYNETLIGYITTATNGLDSAFDGESISSGKAIIYSLVDNKHLVIQGRALPFNKHDVVPLGMKIGTSGQYTINMDQFDGLFENQAIYLFDAFTNTMHDLKASDYLFTTGSGTFHSRFEIRYKAGELLSADAPDFLQNKVTVYRKENTIISNVQPSTILNAEIFDLTGRLLLSQTNINSHDYISRDFDVSPGVVIVRFYLSNHQTVTKKVLLQ